MCVLTSGAAAQSLPNGVASGDVTATTAVLWARSSTVGSLRFEWSTAPEFDDTSDEGLVDVIDAMIPAQLDVRDLQPATTYYYRATDPDGLTASGRFATPALTGRHGLRFGVSGDWRGDLAPFPAVQNVAARDLAIFIALGDTIYADFPSPDVTTPQSRSLAEFRAKHNEVYSARLGLNSLADLRASCAVLVLIDDHEVTNDFSGAAWPDSDPRFDGDEAFINETTLFRNGLQAFHEYNPLRVERYDDSVSARFAGKFKLYRQRTYGLDAAFFLLDARSFRDAPVATTNPVDILLDPLGFLREAFESRTMLGDVQMADLKQDLITAEQAGITWKFVMVPEPIQNLGPILAGDRFEGYAAERADLLSFIERENLHNVVFVSADIHGTLVNDLSYQDTFDGPQHAVRAFEITTGAVAFDPPFGPLVLQVLDRADVGLIAELFVRLYDSASVTLKNGMISVAANTMLGLFGYDPLGIDAQRFDSRLLEGQWAQVHHYGWTEFEIDPLSQGLTVTTWGIEPYGQSDLQMRPADVIARVPQIVSKFSVQPECTAAFECEPPPPPLCGTGLLPLMGFAAMSAGRSHNRSGR
jgi:phosphodiesterase/alkaline phosphatase D-like protein